ncbi:MAG: polysaccharide deacetylase family protein, partial [Clostridia bacterium]|nr:polysaccharide deacetylase family protein [Clostridia bacterium]
GDSQLEKEITELNDNFYNITKTNMKFMRPPRGEFSERTLYITQKMGYKSIFWSIAYADWNTNSQKGADYATEQVTKQFHNGAIILLHAVSADNANGLEEIINNAKQQGCVFKSLEDL